MIRIAYLIDTILSPTGGTEKQLLLLLNALSRDKFEPILCCLRSSEWLEREFRECPLINLGIDSFGNIKVIAKFYWFCRFLRRNQIDIVQTQFHDFTYFGILAAKLAGVRTIISTRRGMPYWQNSLELLFTRLINSAVNVFVANSNVSREFFCTVEHISQTKMRVIYNGIDVTRFPIDTETRDANRAKLGIDPGTHAIGIVANLRPVKGIDVFLQAATLVKRKLPNTRFFIVGDGPVKSELVSIANSLGLSSNVFFLGQRMDVADILAALDVGVLSSHSESFSNSIIEYHAAGLPVVCTDVGGAKEAVVNGATGFLVPAGDAPSLADRIIRILHTPSIRQMGICGRQRVRDLFSVQSMLQQYEELYMGYHTRKSANSFPAI